MSKKEALAEFNRTQILSAAKILFQEKGIEATTVDEIAAKAEYSKSTMYTYFKSKDEMYNYIILEYMTLLKQTFEAVAASGDDFSTSFFAVCKTLERFQENHPLYFEALLGYISVEESDLKSDPILMQIYQVGEEVNKIIVGLFIEGKKQGFLKDDLDPVPTAFLLWGSLSGMISLAGHKERYLSKSMGLSRSEFLAQGYTLLLSSISQ